MVGDGDAGVEGAERAGWTAHRPDGDGFDALPVALSR
jgi:FMN phosphatase YigB (HAD superfamily)